VDVRIGIGDSASVELNGDGDPSQHRQKRVQPFDGVETATERLSAEQEHAEAEPHTPSVCCFSTPAPCAPFALQAWNQNRHQRLPRECNAVLAGSAAGVGHVVKHALLVESTSSRTAP